MRFYIISLFIMSLISFLLYGIDKNKAKMHKWRIKESILILSGAMLGSIGSLLGMKLFHHKTKKKHWYFPFLNIIFLIIQLSLAIYIYLKLGF